MFAGLNSIYCISSQKGRFENEDSQLLDLNEMVELLIGTNI